MLLGVLGYAVPTGGRNCLRVEITVVCPHCFDWSVLKECSDRWNFPGWHVVLCRPR